MEPYFLVALAVAVLGFLSTVTGRHLVRQKVLVGPARPSASVEPIYRKWTYFDLLLVALLVCFSALRFQVGTDYYTYLRQARLIDPAWNWWTQLSEAPNGYGSTLVTLIAKSISDSPYGFLWIMSALTVIPIFAALKRQSDDIIMAALLYVLLAHYIAPFNVARQGVAVALNFWAAGYLDTNKKAFVAINAVAALFHPSALIAAVIQFAAMKWRPRRIGIGVLLGLSVIAATQIDSIPWLTNGLAVLNPRYESYLTAGDAAGIGTYLLISVYLGMLLVCIFLGSEGRERRWLTFIAIGVCFLIIGTQSVVLGRMASYFTVYIVLLLPNQLAARPNSMPLKIGVVAAAAVYYGMYLTHFGAMIPYQTYL